MNQFVKLIRRYNELWLIVIGLVLWFVSPYLIHQVDETAATYDVAVLQKLIFGLIVFSFSTFNVWIALRLTFPALFKYLTEDFESDFLNLNPEQKWEKLKLSLAVFALYLLGLLLAMQVL
jgi:hypothetical protein